MADDPRNGTEAPDFTLESANGTTVTLRSLRGQRVVLFFVREFS